MMPAIDILKETPLFSCFTEKQLGLLEKSLNVSKLKKGEKLFNQGTSADYFYFVVEGIVNLTHVTVSGEERVIEIIRSENFFAEALMFLGHPTYPVSAVLAKDSKFIAINCQQYMTILRGSSDVCFSLLGNLSKRLHQLVSDINALTLYSAESRVAAFVSNCLTIKSGNLFSLELPKQVIASRLSMKPETFSRALHHLDKINVIQLNNKEILVLDKTRLDHIANQDLG